MYRVVDLANVWSVDTLLVGNPFPAGLVEPHRGHFGPERGDVIGLGAGPTSLAAGDLERSFGNLFAFIEQLHPVGAGLPPVRLGPAPAVCVI